MPMQKIETVDMPRSEALASGQTTLGELQTTMHDDFRNRLIWGDNKLVMASLLKDFRGKIDLIYIDPPFDVGADFVMMDIARSLVPRLRTVRVKNTRFKIVKNRH